MSLTQYKMTSLVFSSTVTKVWQWHTCTIHQCALHGCDLIKINVIKWYRLSDSFNSCAFKTIGPQLGTIVQNCTQQHEINYYRTELSYCDTTDMTILKCSKTTSKNSCILVQITDLVMPVKFNSCLLRSHLHTAVINQSVNQKTLIKVYGS